MQENAANSVYILAEHEPDLPHSVQRVVAGLVAARLIHIKQSPACVSRVQYCCGTGQEVPEIDNRVDKCAMIGAASRLQPAGRVNQGCNDERPEEREHDEPKIQSTALIGLLSHDFAIFEGARQVSQESSLPLQTIEKHNHNASLVR